MNDDKPIFIGMHRPPWEQIICLLDGLKEKIVSKQRAYIETYHGRIDFDEDFLGMEDREKNWPYWRLYRGPKQLREIWMNGAFDEPQYAIRKEVRRQQSQSPFPLFDNATFPFQHVVTGADNKCRCLETIEWISVDDRLPDFTPECFVSTPSGVAYLPMRLMVRMPTRFVMEAGFGNGKFMDFSNKTIEPTHWAEMPKGPQA